MGYGDFQIRIFLLAFLLALKRLAGAGFEPTI